MWLKIWYMLESFNHFACRNSTAKFVHNFDGRAYLPYREIYGVNFVISWWFSFTIGNRQESYIGLYVYMYRFFQDFSLAMQDLTPMVGLSPKYYVCKALMFAKLWLVTVNGIKQRRKYGNMYYSLDTYNVSKYGLIPNSGKHVLSSEYNSGSTDHIPYFYGKKYSW